MMGLENEKYVFASSCSSRVIYGAQDIDNFLIGIRPYWKNIVYSYSPTMVYRTSKTFDRNSTLTEKKVLAAVLLMGGTLEQDL